MKQAIFWHRRDLRISDNAGLYQALKSGFEIIPVFIFDTSILNLLPSSDQRVIFIHQTISELQVEYRLLGSELNVFYGNPLEIIPKIAEENCVDSVFVNRDYEPAAIERDKTIFEKLQTLKIDFKGAKDHVVFEKNEILKSDGLPYTVFTPYMRRWKETLTDFHLKSYPVEKYIAALSSISISSTIPDLVSMGFDGIQTVEFPVAKIPEQTIENYDQTRDFPAIQGTSKLGLHLRFGTISIRKLAMSAKSSNEKYLNELIWRDFYQMIVFHFPHAAKDAFRPAYDRIEWSKNEKHFELWCEGKTGYPLVDAGMRELNATGFMHNRVRMVVASFLSKHLLLDWRWGAAYFAEKLLDFDLASNHGGWQWAAGCGCDAAPYFRVFNPALQLEKFDKNLEYVRKWIPEFGTDQYPQPMVDHKEARERAIATYKKYLQQH